MCVEMSFVFAPGAVYLALANIPRLFAGAGRSGGARGCRAEATFQHLVD
jgi:hypothetical protein